MTRLAVRYCSAALAALLLSPVASAEYVVSVVGAETNLSTGSAYPGETLELALLMSGEGEFDGFGVSVEATDRSVEFGEWVLDPIFGPCGANDDFECEGPYLTALTETGGTYFAVGHLARLQVRIDPSVVVGSMIVVEPVIDFFSYGFDYVEVVAGAPFVMTIVPAAAPNAIKWESVRNHQRTGVYLGDIPLEITDDGNFSEPRQGMSHIVITFDADILPETATRASVQVTGRGPDQHLLDLSGISLSVRPIEGNSKMDIFFYPSLPNFARYRVTLNGVASAGGAIIGGGERIFTALLGDANGNLKVRTNDVAGIRSLAGSNVTPDSELHVRSDVNLDARITAQDVGGLRPQVGKDATHIADP